MRTTSRKLKRLIEEEEKTMARIAELQEYLKKIRETRKNEEDQEIIKSIRSMKLGARDLLDLLTAIQEGNLSEDLREQLLADPEEEADADGEDADPAGDVMTTPEDIGKEPFGRTHRKAVSGTDADERPDPDDEGGAMDAPESEENNDDRQHD